MRIPNDTITGSPTTHIKVERTPEGKFTAHNASLPGIPPITANSQRDAIEAVRAQTEKWICTYSGGEGGRFSSNPGRDKG